MSVTVTTMDSLGTDAPDGMQIGASATSKLGVLGATPVSQASAITSPATTVSTSTSAWGFATSTQANALITAVNSLLTEARNRGFVASA